MILKVRGGGGGGGHIPHIPHVIYAPGPSTLLAYTVLLASYCHGSACPDPFPITAHTLTCFHLSLIEHTCNHLPLPCISSLTSITHRLVSRLQEVARGCKRLQEVARGCTATQLSTLVNVCLSARPSWISSLPEEMQVYIQ